jgi:hypothetical protein
MILVAGVALALLVIVLLRSGTSNEQIVARLGTQKDPRVVAAAAEVLEARGMKLTAEVLRARARSLGGAGAKTSATSSGEGGPVLRSPFPEASDAAWTEFVQTLAGPVADARTAAGRLGRFGMHLRRLEDLRCVRGVERAEDGRVVARWVPPLTEEMFLADPRLQYRALTLSLRGLRSLVLGSEPPLVGRLVGRTRATLSGLLAVAHRLGFSGLVAWVESPITRERQRVATSMFERANGRF